MATKPKGPPFPTSTGKWLAVFRHRRRKADGTPISPEDLGRMIRKSGATVRRWEANRGLPDEEEIARIADACDLSPLQIAFLSAACTRMRAMPAPPSDAFRRHMSEALSSTPHPAVLHDGLFYLRGWNSYVEALAPGAFRDFGQPIHPVAMMLRAPPSTLLTPAEYEQTLRAGLRIFWMNTAIHSHRPEYANMLADLDREPRFRELWMELGLSSSSPGADAPISFAHSLGGAGAMFRVYSRTITFPPTYHINEYHPAEAVAQARVDQLREQGPPVVRFKRELHWVKSPPFACQ